MVSQPRSVVWFLEKTDFFFYLVLFLSMWILTTEFSCTGVSTSQSAKNTGQISLTQHSSSCPICHSPPWLHTNLLETIFSFLDLETFGKISDLILTECSVPWEPHPTLPHSPLPHSRATNLSDGNSQTHNSLTLMSNLVRVSSTHIFRQNCLKSTECLNLFS